MYIPLNDPHVSYAQTKPFAKAVAELLEAAEGDLVVVAHDQGAAQGQGADRLEPERREEQRPCACTRCAPALPRPTVSAPLDWEEVRSARERGDAAGLAFEADGVLARVADRGDLFAPVLSLVQELPNF